ncbi:tyrosine-type recombinase/integrase [Ureibacillus sp. Re31]|uniref:Tyrosine-type recombinase/integrase n=1 Tax=Ureibacillus galli TaxID=2762222 RepID=A0ABR8X8F3_9BACL|nr:tyrosine-type recombinase/integrase [Ureibacillus galli]MBD8025575.1 tyrosine-type recombinase/integrase [Ureibacillus galli]
MAKVVKFKNSIDEIIFLVTSNEGKPYFYVNKYIKFLQTIKKSTNTIKSYAYRLKLYWDYVESYQMDFKKITMDDFVKYVGWLQGNGNIHSKNRSTNTINYNVTAVFGFYNYLARFHSEVLETELDFYTESIKKYSYRSFLEHTKSSVKSKLKVLKLREVKKTYKKLSAEQLKKIFNYKMNLRNRLLLQILYETGMRISEALNIKLEDIDISDKKILITKSKTPYGENRWVYLSADTINLLQDYIYEIHEKNNFDSDYLFLKLTGNQRGQPCDYSTVEAFFKSVSKMVGFKVTPHMFRHTLATELHESNVEISIIKAILGHKDVQTTINMYIHPSEKSIRTEFDKVVQNREKGKENVKSKSK